MQPGSTSSTPRHDSAAVRDNLADIRAKLSFQLNSGGGGGTSSYLDNNNNNTSFNQNGSFSRFRQRPLFTFGNAAGAHRDPTHQTMGGTPQRGMSSDRPQTPVGRSPSTQASAQYLLSTQRELERVQRDKHEWERRCMELESTNAELTNELEYLSGCLSQQQPANEDGSSTYPLSNNGDVVGPGIDLRASNTSNTSSPPAQQHQQPTATPGISQEEVAKLHARIASLTASLDEVSSERDSLLSQHQATGNQLEVLMNEYEKEKAAKDLQVSALEKELEKVNQSCGKALRAAEQMQARHENEIAEMEAELLEAREELDNVTSEHAAAASNNDSTNAKTDALQQQVDLLTQKLKSAEANSSSLEEELTDVRSQLVSSERLQLELEEDQRTLEEEVLVAKKLIEELTTKNTTLNDTYTSLMDTQPACEQLEIELTRLQNQLDAQIASSNAREKQLETVMAEREEEFKEQLDTLESQRELDQQAIADLQGQLKTVMAESAETTEKLRQQQAAAVAAETNEDSISSTKLAEDESSAIAWLTGQLAEMTESMEGVCTTSPTKDTTDITAINSDANEDDDPMTVALEAAEKAQQLLQHSSYDSQTELQIAIEDCARGLQERQHTHLSMHRENLKTRELKKKEWMNRKLEDVEAAYVAKIDGLESMLEELQEQLVAHDAGDDDELANAKEECKQYKAACEALETLIKEQEAQLEQLTNDASSTQESNAKTAQYEKEIATLRASLEDRTSAYDDLKEAQAVLEQQIDNEDQDRAANSSARDAALMSRLTGLTEEYEAVVAERDAFLEEIKDLKESIAEKEEALKEADTQLQQQQEKLEKAVQPATNAVISSSPPPSSPSAAWPSSSSVLGAEIDHKLPIDTLEALIAECGHFEDLTFSKPHVYDHTCWAFDAFHLDDPASEAGYGPHLLLHICCSTYRDIVDPDWSLEDGSITEMDAKATSMGLPPMNTFLTFIATVYNGYHHRSSVPYHNRTHAADIVQTTVLLVRNALLPKHVAASATATADTNSRGGDEDTPTYLWDVLSPLDRFALLIASLTHDFNHPGKKNIFLSRIHDPVAVRYSGKSVLENHHATATFSICQDATMDITEYMSVQQRDNFHNQVTTMILNTDMALHGKHLEEFAQKAVYPLFTGSGECAFNEVTNPKDRLDAMCTLLHAADVGNTARPFHIARKWGVAVRDEFFAQGALEKLLGYEISFGCDEEADIKSGGIGPDQLSFIDNMILPFWHVLVKRYGVEAPGCEDLLEEYHSLLDGILNTQQAILDEALEVSSDPVRGEDVSIPLTFDMENAEAFAWRGAYGLQMMVDALQANRLMWLKMSAPEHQSRFPIGAPADKAYQKIVALNNATSIADSKEEAQSASTTPKKLSSVDNDGPASCSDCDLKHNALVEMQKALEVGQQDVEELLANKAVLLKQLTQAQEDLEAAAAANAAPPVPDARPALEEQHQARVKQLKEMIMNANQKKNELEVENKELKRRVLELEASTSTTTNTPLATVTSPTTTHTSPTPAASSRPVSRYGVQGSMSMGGGSSSSEDGSPSGDEEGISTTARRQSF